MLGNEHAFFYFLKPHKRPGTSIALLLGRKSKHRLNDLSKVTYLVSIDLDLGTWTWDTEQAVLIPGLQPFTTILHSPVGQ